MNRTISSEKIAEIKRMRAAGSTYAEIIKAVGVNKKTAYRYAHTVEKKADTTHRTPKENKIASRYDVAMLEWYKRRLKPEQSVKVMIYESPDSAKETAVSGTVKKVYPHIAEAEMVAPVLVQGVEVRKRKRVETVKIVDLMLMNTGGAET